MLRLNGQFFLAPPSGSSTSPPGGTDTTGDFCSTHNCIENFDKGNGYIVQCQDGEWSHSGGDQGGMI
jgi:hypothetical protein